ncbi:MAG: TlpA family protein disulfide reductase [Acidimicrobiia bacterium]|nr:TlpA family protein disulfide reductase [Acidimicrobiia bacterium]
MTRNQIIPLATIVVGGVLFMSLADWEPTEKDVAVGYWHDGRLQDAPDFALPTLEGDTLTLSDYRGKIVVLNIWATWCAPCRKEMPDFVSIQDELGPYGVQFIGVSIDGGGFEVIAPFAAEFNVNYPLVLDDGSVYDSYEGSTGVPTTYLINRSGQIWHYMPGALSRNMLLPALRLMLET